jgi:integrase
MPAKIRKRGENSYELCVSGGIGSDKKQVLYRKTVHADNLREAEKLYKLFAAEVVRGKVLESGSEKMTLDQFFEYFKINHAERHYQNTTLRINQDVFERISAALGHQRINKIQPKHILKFITELEAPDASVNDTPLSSAYIRKHISVLKTLFKFACEWKLILDNPCVTIKLPKSEKSSKKILTEAELKEFLKLLAKHKDFKHQVWVMLAFSLGLRREEIFGLQWQDIDFDKRLLTIARAAVYVAGTGIVEKDTKTDNSFRTLSLPPDIAAMLMKWKDEVIAAAKRRNKRNKIVKFEDPTAPEKWLFPQVNGSVGHPHAFNNFLRRFCEDNGITNIGPHVFRHLSGSYLLKAGIDIATVSSKLGHSDKSFTLKTYIHEIRSAEQHSASVMQSILDDLKAPENFKATESKKEQA